MAKPKPTLIEVLGQVGDDWGYRHEFDEEDSAFELSPGVGWLYDQPGGGRQLLSGLARQGEILFDRGELHLRLETATGRVEMRNPETGRGTQWWCGIEWPLADAVLEIVWFGYGDGAGRLWFRQEEDWR